MKTGFLHCLRGEPSRGAKPGGSKLGVSRTNSFVRFHRKALSMEILISPCINHKWRRSTMLFRPAE
jgi:hypothetical protein